MEEIWKDVSEFEGRYQVSNLSNIRSLDRVYPHPKNPQCMSKFSGRVLKKGVNIDGYHTVMLNDYTKGKPKLRRVCRLVALAFVPNTRDIAKEVNHIDGNKTNDLPDNLEWATRSENEQHAYDTGLAKASHTPKKLTEDMVHEIRKLCKEGNHLQREIASMFGITQPNVSGIIHRTYWGHV